jgi:putative hydrolase of the HAD superfamily
LKKYTHIFFDLDHTLWDYDANSTEALTEVYHEFGMDQLFTTPTSFIGVFHHVNHGLWDRYNKGEIDREDIRQQRFAMVMKGRTEPDRKLSMAMSDYFIAECPKKPNLIDGAKEVLDSLLPHYSLSIITNGFDDTQATKLKFCGIDHYFDQLITSETTGSRKPDREIFDHAISLTKADPQKVLMIGDNLNTDIAGARAAGWEAVWFNPTIDNHEQVPHKPVISHLSEILDLVSS